MERKVGERFKEGNTLLETVKESSCSMCFYDGNGCEVEDVHGNCCVEDRKDEEDVIFKEVKNGKLVLFAATKYRRRCSH